MSSRTHALSLVFGGFQSHEVGTGLNLLLTEALSLRSLYITLCSLLNRQERLQGMEEHVRNAWNVQEEESIIGKAERAREQKRSVAP